MAGDLMKIDKEMIKEINKTARRNARKRNGGQDKFHSKVEKSKKRYTRKVKHREPLY